MISIIIPTIKGRETALRRCMAAYEETCDDFEMIIIRDRKACGIAWIEGAEEATGDYLHFTADDLIPHPGWAEAAIACVEKGNLPAASVLNPDTVLDCPVYLEPQFRNVPNVLVPFFSREQFEMGEWLVPIHYGSDDWVTYMAVRRGIEIELLDAYRFSHTADENGRLWMNRAIDVPKLVTLMERKGYVPPVYGQLAVSFGWSGWVG